MHDFHLHLVLEMLGGGREIPEWLDMKGFLSQFVRESSLPAGAFNRNRLERGIYSGNDGPFISHGSSISSSI